MASITDVMQTPKACGHCGMWHGPVCPRIKAVDYYPDGSIKRVEYREPETVASGGSQIALPPGWQSETPTRI